MKIPIFDNRGILVVRVSSKDQSKYSLPAQLETGQSYAQRHSIAIWKTHIIKETASKETERKQMAQVYKEAVENDIPHLMFEKVDRALRGYVWMLQFYDWLDKKEKRKLHLIHNGLVLDKNSRSQEKMHFEMEAVWAKNYIDRMVEEITKGHGDKIKNGIYPGPVTKFAYKRVKNIPHQVLDEEKAKLFRECYHLIDNDYSIRSVVEKAFEMGLRNKNGNKISKSQMHKYLIDVFNKGWYSWNGEIHKNGAHPALVSEEFFDRVMAKLRRNPKSKTKRHFHLLKGLVRCGECEDVVAWFEKKGHIYGRCIHSRECHQSQCGRQDRVETKIVKVLKQVKIKDPETLEWIRDELVRKAKIDIDVQETSRNELNQQINKYERMSSVAYTDKLKGIITEEKYIQVTTDIDNDIEQLKKSLKNIDQRTKYKRQLALLLFDLVNKGDEIFLKSKKDDPKRQTIKLLFKELALKNGKIRVVPKEATRAIIELNKYYKSSSSLNIEENKNRKLELLDNLDNIDVWIDLQTPCPVQWAVQDSNL